ncbi:CYTH domain-containing protein [Mucilaginibacter sp. BJC16-A38]|uniref:CYTH domain-containing protein n=1 Tax=Mucilaginibacter phenanthrenivorans TaxID=1234842 RepID=UPI0021582E97|nr:CYTH domain-containing protein [Mucilaginibacter phenanthrenivorans]MCR8557153.1 CYTH domain-containing protein [Mucilaginibacter phenanthrenivorans]
MGIEIERKFLVDHEKWSKAPKSAGTYFRQGYLLNEKNRTFRVRVADTRAFITIKGGTSGISRKEFEYEIPVADGIELLDNFAISQVEKTRYCIDFAGKLWEVDEFYGDNAGLITAEIELQHEDEAFELPEWVAVEVSMDARYYNSNLSVNPFNTWNK